LSIICVFISLRLLRSLRGISFPELSENLIYPVENNNNRTSTTRHVLFGLSGNHTGFLAEFEVALKSVLLNGPRDSMDIHIMADEDAFEALYFILHTKANLVNWVKIPWPIHIKVYNIQNLEEGWKHIIESRFAVATNFTSFSLYRHTIGAYYRIFANEVLPPYVDNVLYIDTDVVILGSLEDIWQQQAATDEDILFSWGARMCSGFMILRPKHETELWELYSQAPEPLLKKIIRGRPVVDDQFLLTVVQKEFPQRVGIISPEWDISAADGSWKRDGGKQMQAGMLHFNGGGESKVAYFEEHTFLKDPIWGLVKYYVNMPWSWANFLLTSKLKSGEQSYSVQVSFETRT